MRINILLIYVDMIGSYGKNMLRKVARKLPKSGVFENMLMAIVITIYTCNILKVLI